MQRHVGDEFVGTVTAVTNFGLFVTLNELFIDGLIHISNLSAEYYDYDEREQALIGDKGSIFRLGEQLTIKVAGVNMDLLQVDFALVKKPDQIKKPDHTSTSTPKKSQNKAPTKKRTNPKKS